MNLGLRFVVGPRFACGEGLLGEFELWRRGYWAADLELVNTLSASRVVFVLDGYAFARSGSCIAKFAIFWRSRARVMSHVSLAGNGSNVGGPVDQMIFKTWT